MRGDLLDAVVVGLAALHEEVVSLAVGGVAGVGVVEQLLDADEDLRWVSTTVARWRGAGDVPA